MWEDYYNSGTMFMFGLAKIGTLLFNYACGVFMQYEYLVPSDAIEFKFESLTWGYYTINW